MRTNFQKTLVYLTIAAFLTLVFTAMTNRAGAADEYWRTDGNNTGTWTSTFWNIGSANATGGTGWTSGNNAVFTANSTNTFATSTVGNVSVSNNCTVTITNAGTLTLGGVRTFFIGSGATLNWASQSQSSGGGNTGSGLTLNGAGTLNWGSPGNNSAINGAYTINGGTIIVSGKYSYGIGPLTFNGGTIQSSGGNVYLSSSLTIGGDFTFSGTAADTYTMSIALGSATRNITNSTSSGSAIRALGGVISGGANVGLNFWGGGSGTINLTNTGNTFTGPISINGAEVQFQNDGSFGAVPGSATPGMIVIDGGRLTAADGTQSGVSFTLNSNRGIQLGATAGTSISVKSGATLTYNGIIADKPSSAGILVKQGAGTLALGGASTYSGGTSNNNGTIQLTTGNNRLPTGTTLNIGQGASVNTGIFDLNSFNQQIAGLNSTIGSAVITKNMVTNSSASMATFTLGGTGNYAYGDGTANNSGIISGPINLVKSGSGLQTLGDTNTYTGTTLVSGGTLLVNGFIGTNTVTVTNATLGGTGTIGGTTILQTNGILAAGIGGIGTLTFTNSLTLNAASTNSFVVTSTGGASNKVAVLGTLTAGRSAIKITSGTALGLSTNTLFTYGSFSGSFNPTVVFDIAPVHIGSIVNDTVSKKINLVITNRAPVAGSSFTMNVVVGMPSTVQIVGGKYTPTDADGDVLTITGVSGTTNGTATTDGTNIAYTAAGAGIDSFTYTVSDPYGGTATQTINVVIDSSTSGQTGHNSLSLVPPDGSGNIVLTFAGIPTFNYALDGATNLVSPVVWVPLLTNTVGGTGSLSFTVNTNSGAQFFRTRWVH